MRISPVARFANAWLADYVPVYGYEFNDAKAPMYMPTASFPYGAAHTVELVSPPLTLEESGLSVMFYRKSRIILAVRSETEHELTRLVHPVYKISQSKIPITAVGELAYSVTHLVYLRGWES